MTKIVYQSANYRPDLVTGRYVRCTGTKRKGYTFRVYETASGTGRFAGKPGMGPTLREIDTDGSDLPEEVKARAIDSKCMERID